MHTPDTMAGFLDGQFYGAVAEEGDRFTFAVGEEGRGGAVELVVNRCDDPGTWAFGDGTIHHFAWDLEDDADQDAVEFEIEGVGYTDICELEDRTCVESVCVRTPSGALFELALTTPLGWATDESPNELGSRFPGAAAVRGRARHPGAPGADRGAGPPVSPNPHAERPVERCGAEPAPGRAGGAGRART